MAIIRPVSDMQRKSGEIAKLAKETKEPVYLTKNGSEYLVLIDAQEYERITAGNNDAIKVDSE